MDVYIPAWGRHRDLTDESIHFLKPVFLIEGDISPVAGGVGERLDVAPVDVGQVEHLDAEPGLCELAVQYLRRLAPPVTSVVISGVRGYNGVDALYQVRWNKRFRVAGVTDSPVCRAHLLLTSAYISGCVWDGKECRGWSFRATNIKSMMAALDAFILWYHERVSA